MKPPVGNSLIFDCAAPLVEAFERSTRGTTEPLAPNIPVIAQPDPRDLILVDLDVTDPALTPTRARG